jgi:hypothetical protein
MGATGVILHTEGYGTACFGASSYLIELEAHEGFDEGGFSGGLMPYYYDCGGVKWLLKVLRLLGEDGDGL